jgi:hypothetical protein
LSLPSSCNMSTARRWAWSSTRSSPSGRINLVIRLASRLAVDDPVPYHGDHRGCRRHPRFLHGGADAGHAARPEWRRSEPAPNVRHAAVNRTEDSGFVFHGGCEHTVRSAGMPLICQPICISHQFVATCNVQANDLHVCRLMPNRGGRNPSGEERLARTQTSRLLLPSLSGKHLDVQRAGATHAQTPAHRLSVKTAPLPVLRQMQKVTPIGEPRLGALVDAIGATRVPCSTCERRTDLVAPRVELDLLGAKRGPTPDLDRRDVRAPSPRSRRGRGEASSAGMAGTLWDRAHLLAPCH